MTDPEDVGKAHAAQDAIETTGGGPIGHLVSAAAGRGGLPRSVATCVIDSVDEDEGETLQAVT